MWRVKQQTADMTVVVRKQFPLIVVRYVFNLNLKMTILLLA